MSIEWYTLCLHYNKTIKNNTTMKKFIFILTFIFVAISANAQLNIKSFTKEIPKEIPKEIMSLQMAYLYKFEDRYLICMNTSNKFDRHQTVILLGDSLESALQTAKDLKEIIDMEIAMVEVSQGDGWGDLSLSYQNNLGVKQLCVRQKGNAGMSWLTLRQIEKIISYFESKLG